MFSRCDFMNFAKNTVCLQCDAKRPKRQLLPGEWECPQYVTLFFSIHSFELSFYCFLLHMLPESKTSIFVLTMPWISVICILLVLAYWFYQKLCHDLHYSRAAIPPICFLIRAECPLYIILSLCVI